MRKAFQIVAIIFAIIAVIGGCGIDTEGTFVPWVMAIVGMIGALLFYKFSIAII